MVIFVVGQELSTRFTGMNGEKWVIVFFPAAHLPAIDDTDTGNSQ